jgi:hypothetical protein
MAKITTSTAIDLSRKYFSNFYSLLKENLSDNITSFLFRLANIIYNVIVPITALVILIVGIVFAFKTGMFSVLIVAILLSFLVFFGDYIASKFNDANSQIISSNETRISTNAYLELSAFINIFVAIFLPILTLIAWINSPYLVSFAGVIGALFLSLILILMTIPLLNPKLINLIVTKESTVAEDFITITTVLFKIMTFYANLIAKIITILGSVLVIIYGFSVIASSGFEIMDNGLQFLMGIGIVSGGLFFPVIIYLVFLYVFLIADIILSILSIRRISK